MVVLNKLMFQSYYLLVLYEIHLPGEMVLSILAKDRYLIVHHLAPVDTMHYSLHDLRDFRIRKLSESDKG